MVSIRFRGLGKPIDDELQDEAMLEVGDNLNVSEPALDRRLAARSPFLFVCGDDRVIRYTGADVDTGGAEDVQMAE
ncbi:hypothetical protein DEO72_LG6g1256 [Vigna unguiculata]|uniref:Uncharacterized protein n=1 Tax=Vigna unguiculata TaxID=3917 RepID=A0A4D6M793_VIGUN|nr:hypothetical protein DEO72_LG6g1256 [Vigna unguiculata]